MDEEGGHGSPAGDDKALDHDSVMMEEVKIRRLSRRSLIPRTSSIPDPLERVVVDRTALEGILDVSSRIQNIQKKSRVSMSTLALGHESYKDKKVNKLCD